MNAPHFVILYFFYVSEESCIGGSSKHTDYI